MSSIEMPGTIKYGERKLEKIAEFYYSPFFASHLYMHLTLKETPSTSMQVVPGAAAVEI